MKVKFCIASFAILFSFHYSHSQNVKTIVTKLGEKSSGLKEVYHVLKDSPSIKHGTYEYFAGTHSVVSGSYYHGEKDGVWDYHNYKGVCNERMYNKGMKTGIWQNTNRDGQLTCGYDFSKGQGIEYIKGEHLDTLQCYVQLADGRWGKDTSVKSPVSLFTSFAWSSFLMTNLRYPEEALNRHATGRVMVTITCDESGHAINYEVISNTDSSLNAEALRVIRLFDFEFLPPEKEGKKIKFQIDQPVGFKLE